MIVYFLRGISVSLEQERKQMSHDTSGIIDVERKQPVNINTIKKGDRIKDKWGYAIVESISKKKVSC